MNANVGLITGLVRERIEADPYATFEWLAGLGYRGIEGRAVLAGDAAENRRRREALGLEALGVSVKYCASDEDVDRAIADAHAAGAPHVMCYWGPCTERDELLAACDRYDQIGRRCKQNGLKFCYHNHDHELAATFPDGRGLDVLAAHTDPTHVHLELDLGWVLFGGADPADTLRRYAGRSPVVHLKDVADLTERGRFTAVGTGLLDVRKVVTVGLETGVEWFSVEQDRVNALTGEQSVMTSIFNLREMGLTDVRQDERA